MMTKTICQGPEFWRRKLFTFLHDPPDKCFDLGKHAENAASFQAGTGFVDEEERKQFDKALKEADHFAAAADRFVFPKGKCATSYNGQGGSSFIHPLSSNPYLVPDRAILEKAGLLHEVLKDAVGGNKTDDWRVRFFLYWRRWLENAVTTEKQNARHLAFSPADSRIPDHSIWNHMSISSALAGCIDSGEVRPALLLFQLGPVQDFIAQARSTRDLWSGSYLLSWLMANAMKAVSDQVGPDAMIFPSLRGNGIFDALHREEMYSTMFRDRNNTEMSLWNRMLEEKGKDRGARWLLTPTLPNRFLALVPASKAEGIAGLAEDAIRKELKVIGEAVWKWVEAEAEGKAGCTGVANWKQRWDFQLAAFPQITWAVQPWLDRETCLAEFAKLPLNAPGQKTDGQTAATPLQRLQDMLDLAEKWLPFEDRDPRYYVGGNDGPKNKLKNPGALWAAHYALADAKLAARRNTRDFIAWSNPAPDSSVKDSLSGKEECIGDETFWKYLGELDSKLFPQSHRYGAMNLIKRLWCRSDKIPYLCAKLGLTENEFGKALRFETVSEIACRNTAGVKGNDENGDDEPSNPYVAVLAMDGDEMGKWVSGEKAPEFLRQISEKAREYLEPILKGNGKSHVRRLLSPSYHLQFSEALANYSTWLVEPIVDKFDGQLIYSGGDDVLAMLPADAAIACAEALRAVFRGHAPEEQSKFDLAVTDVGYVNENAGYPMVVPGPEADVSIGLAIGHCNAPLQMLVKEAQRAEKTAKNRYGRGALAISLYKRSGETIEWGCKWDSEPDRRVALKLMRKVTEWAGGDNPPISGRFPYALAQLLNPYALNGKLHISPESMNAVILKEFAHIVDQQGAGLGKEDKKALNDMAADWLAQTDARPEDFVKLFLVETFINRHRGE